MCCCAEVWSARRCSGALVLTVVVLDNYAVKLFGAMILELITPVPTFPAETGHANSKIR